MVLKGLKVIELAGLAPAPFCGMILADFGASVIRVEKVGHDNIDLVDYLANGKKSLCINLKHQKGVHILRTLCKSSDVLIEPFRVGVMEKLGVGPSILLKDNPKLIYARLSGYGQIGQYSRNAGHDINFLAISGLLSMLGRKDENPVAPLNIVADMGGGGLMCALGILLAIIDRNKSGLGQVVDNSMTHGSAYLGSWIYRTQKLPIWGEERGRNMLDTGHHYYETYKTKDGKYLAVGAIEPQFYKALLNGLGLSEDEAPQFGDHERLKKLFTSIFLQKTRQEWSEIFDSSEACVTPVLSFEEASNHPHNLQQNCFVKTKNGYAPNPAPILSRTPGRSQSLQNIPKKGEHTKDILKSLNFTTESINQLEKEEVIECYKHSKL